MRFGWLTLAASPTPETDAACIDQQLELAVTAEALGFHGIWLTEHYFTGESVYNDALTFAAAIAMILVRPHAGAELTIVAPRDACSVDLHPLQPLRIGP